MMAKQAAFALAALLEIIQQKFIQIQSNIITKSRLMGGACNGKCV